MFGELVCGPPGSGKTTYCEGKRQFLSVYDPTRPVTLLNLDPANEGVFPYPCDVDIREVVNYTAIMQDTKLGPNGAYLYCMSVMETCVQWIVENVTNAIERRIQEMTAELEAAHSQIRTPYLLIDCPGQVEFYINSRIMHKLISSLQKQLQCSLCTVHLIDANIATRDIATYVSSCVLSLTTMVDHELPHLNVLTKWDSLEDHVQLTNCNDNYNNILNSTSSANEHDGNNLVSQTRQIDESEDKDVYLNTSNFLDEEFDRQWRRQLRHKRIEMRNAQYYITLHNQIPKLTAADAEADRAIDHINLQTEGGRIYHYSKALMSIIDGYGIVGFVPLDVQSQEMMLKLTQQIDNAIGNFV